MPHNYYSHRRHTILNIINHLGPISRTELITLTDYRPASVSDIIRELLDENLIVETGHSSNGHGRKRTLLEINKEYLCAIGLSFSSRHVTYIVAQIDGNILYKDVSDIRQGIPKEELIDMITTHVSDFLTDFCDRKIVGIGISDPLYDPTNYQFKNTLFANYVHFNDWVHVDLKSKLEALTGLWVETYSSVAMPVMAEQRFGVAKGVQDFICIELSNGIGSSICCNGMPVVGAKGMAGELGHTIIDYRHASQNLCYCGKPGCIESSTSYPALVAEITAALNRGVFSVLNSYPESSNGITPQAIRHALDEGDRMCMYYVKEFSTRLGIVIANVINLLNPELVVLHGFMLELGVYFLEQLKISIRENVLSLFSDVDIRITDSIENTFSLGAVAEIFASYLKEHNYKWIYQMQPTDFDENA